jgi:flagellar biosynthetic protein FliR
MEQTIQEFMAQGVFAFLLTFVRVGAALTIMPGVGDSFTPARVRLIMALGLSMALFPTLSRYIPSPLPPMSLMLVFISTEFLLGLFFGTVARILMSATDTAGMIISMMSGLGNAQVFNPGAGTQGSIIGALLSVTAMVLIFATNTHHLLFLGIMQSYEMFPVGELPDTGSMSEVISRVVSSCFIIAVQMAAPFMVISLMVYIGMGVLSRLMPQVQVFLIAIPLQILLSMVTLTLVMSTLMFFWLSKFESGMLFFFSGGVE